MKEKSTIALVDDERNILTSLRMALEAEGQGVLDGFRSQVDRRHMEQLLLGGTVVVSTIINVVNLHGLGGNWLPHGLEVGGTYLSMFILWCVGVTIANCRYR